MKMYVVQVECCGDCPCIDYNDHNIPRCCELDRVVDRYDIPLDCPLEDI